MADDLGVETWSIHEQGNTAGVGAVDRAARQTAIGDLNRRLALAIALHMFLCLC